METNLVGFICLSISVYQALRESLMMNGRRATNRAPQHWACPPGSATKTATWPCWSPMMWWKRRRRRAISSGAKRHKILFTPLKWPNWLGSVWALPFYVLWCCAADVRCWQSGRSSQRSISTTNDQISRRGMPSMSSCTCGIVSCLSSFDWTMCRRTRCS